MYQKGRTKAVVSNESNTLSEQSQSNGLEEGEIVDEFAGAEVKYYVVNRENSKEDFLRSVAIELALDTDVPEDILESEFEEVDEKSCRFVVSSVTVMGSYSAMIGNDRKVEYRDSNGKNKTKTVTDWQATTGTCTQEIEAFYPIDGMGDGTTLSYHAGGFLFDIENGYVSDEYVAEYSEATFETEKPFGFTNYVLNQLKDKSVRLLSKECQNALPGDRNKNYKFTGSVSKVNALESWVVPCYSVKFQYNGESYERQSFATASHGQSYGTEPKSTSKEKIINRRARGWYWTSVSLSIASILFSVLFSLFFNIWWATLIGVGACIIGGILFAIMRSVIKRKVTQEILSRKLDLLNEYLQVNGMEEFSEEDIEGYLEEKEWTGQWSRLKKIYYSCTEREAWNEQ